MTCRVVEETDKPVSLKDRIDPAHMLQAIENSFEHHHETAHGMTGITFEHYTIIVRKKPGFRWSVECRFKRGDIDLSRQRTKN